jgi:heme/copper-type cytochrome/quinol oxidase subunit 3
MAGMNRPLIAVALGFAAIPYLVLGGTTLFEGKPEDTDVPTWMAYAWGVEALAVGMLLAGGAWLALNGIPRWGAVAKTAIAGVAVIFLTTGLFGLPLVAGLVVLLIVALALRSRTSPDTA